MPNVASVHHQYWKVYSGYYNDMSVTLLANEMMPERQGNLAAFLNSLQNRADILAKIAENFASRRE